MVLPNHTANRRSSSPSLTARYPAAKLEQS